ncbi:E3 ubiquitin/ISG15 ligase TRIM25-like [Engraulis encrasicolus]|uniref:E3 ubiquitin/ISG15 ligase TRIM25-like n=1 Tax=Engraulis encrasicolus TaxID=184585 RepID=UPI002FD4B4CC
MAEELSSLENELKCSVCLEVFKHPVTLPCGHNFCQTCLDDTWSDVLILFCPQCRHLYPTKPELRKNTLLTAVVESFSRSSTSKSDRTKDLELNLCAADTELVKCDTCLVAKAIYTCLTCMASYCEEHVQPHHRSPVFRAHQLVEPIRDIQKQICQDHVKFMEFFCQNHNYTFCSSCLQCHRECQYTTLPEGRTIKESNMKGMLSVLEPQIDKANAAIARVEKQQLQLQDDAVAQKMSMRAEYDVIRQLINMAEKEALADVDKDVASSKATMQGLIKKVNKNVKKMNAAVVEVNSLLSKADTMAFLKAPVKLPPGANSNPQCPCVTVASEAVLAGHSCAVAIKDLLREVLAMPAENRPPLLQPGGPKVPEKASPVAEMALEKREPSSPARLHAVAIPHDISTAMKRCDLLKFGSTLQFDPRTAHRTIVLSADLTTASRSAEPNPYPDGPERFLVCPQVLCSTGYLQGCHYWEAKVSGTRLCGLGLAYGSMNRRLPSSRLGLNAQSWCLEWFNDRLTAWHNGVETVVDNPSPKRVGVLLDCDRGSATFYVVGDRAYPFMMFALPCTEAVYPALWICSVGATVLLCKPQ